MGTIEDFAIQQTEKQSEILHYLHDQFMAFPDVAFKIRYKIPFYFRKSWICYLNPIKKEGIELVFLRGNELSNEQGLLDAKGRKQVMGITFSECSAIPIETVLEVFQEALMLDEAVPYASKRKSTKK